MLRNVVGKYVPATIPKGNIQMAHNQYTVPDTAAVEPTLVAFLFHLQTYVHGLSITLKQNHPQYLTGLSRALFPTTSVSK